MTFITKTHDCYSINFFWQEMLAYIIIYNYYECKFWCFSKRKEHYVRTEMWVFFGDAAPNCPKSAATFIHETTQSSINSSESVKAEIKSLAQNPYGICRVIKWSELPVLKSLYCPHGSACSAGRSCQLSGSSWFGGCKGSCWPLLFCFRTHLFFNR